MKVVELDAAAMAVDAELTISSGDNIMKTTATIEVCLLFRWNVGSLQTRMCLEGGPSTVVQHAICATILS